MASYSRLSPLLAVSRSLGHSDSAGEERDTLASRQIKDILPISGLFYLPRTMSRRPPAAHRIYDTQGVILHANYFPDLALLSSYPIDRLMSRGCRSQGQSLLWTYATSCPWTWSRSTRQERKFKSLCCHTGSKKHPVADGFERVRQNRPRVLVGYHQARQ